LIQQPAADWEHLHEGPQLLVLLQQLRQVLTAAPAIIQSDHTKETRNRGTDRSDGRPENIKEAIFSLFRDKRTRAPTPSAEAYLPTSGGPAGGLTTCGEMALAGEKQASVPCRPSMAARGGEPGGGWGRARGANRGKPGRYGREEEEEERMERVCFYRGVYRFLFSVRVAIPFFWENLGKTLRPARRVASRHTSACGSLLPLPLPCALAP